MGIVGGVIILLILFAAYFSGGYVAGRMARFNGMVQGAAVWVWAVVVAIVVSLLGAVAGGLAGMRFHRRVDRTGLGG